MAFLGPEKAIVHQHCRVLQELSGKSRDRGIQIGTGKKATGPASQCLHSGQVAVRDWHMGQVEARRPRALRRSLSVICTPHFYK